MRKVLLLSINPAHVYKRQKRLLEFLPQCEFVACCNEQDVVRIARSDSFDLAILELEKVVGDKKHLGEVLRAAGLTFPQVITASYPKRDALFSANQGRQQTIFLDASTKTAELAGVAKKLLVSGFTQQPQHPRFSTNYNVVMEKYGSQISLPSEVVNVSQSGAQVEFVDGAYPLFKVGDLVRLTFPLKTSGKIAKLNGHVVWLHSQFSGRRTKMGVHFVR